MTGMKTLIELRKGGWKPAMVTVDLVNVIAKYDAERFSFAEHSGIVSINIAAADGLNDIDFRPLTGLNVLATDCAENHARFRRLCLLISRANPARFVMPVWEGETFTVHQRFAGNPPRTESFSV